jgi:hypothetical protein
VINKSARKWSKSCYMKTIRMTEVFAFEKGKVAALQQIII